MFAFWFDTDAYFFDMSRESKEDCERRKSLHVSIQLSASEYAFFLMNAFANSSYVESMSGVGWG